MGISASPWRRSTIEEVAIIAKSKALVPSSGAAGHYRQLGWRAELPLVIGNVVIACRQATSRLAEVSPLGPVAVGRLRAYARPHEAASLVFAGVLAASVRRLRCAVLENRRYGVPIGLHRLRWGGGSDARGVARESVSVVRKLRTGKL